MRRLLLTVLLLGLFPALLLPGCSRPRRHSLVGQVLGVDTEKQELLIRHEDIKGFMPGMTMPFKVKDPEAVRRHKPGDLVTATLVVGGDTGYLENVVKTGEAPLPDGTAERAPLRMIEPGTRVPDAEFVDQSGEGVRVSDWRGRTTAVTFVYTRCPLPEFCPLMDRHFAAVQRKLREQPALASRVHLVSVSFDPDYDTPAVLREHAERVGADSAQWSFVTGSRESVDAFAGALGVSVIRDDKPMQEIVHNLRTAVIAPDGTLAAVLNGNEWTPDQLFEAIRAADARH